MRPVVIEEEGSSVSHTINTDLSIYDLETPEGETSVSINVTYNMLDLDVVPVSCDVSWQRLLADGTDDNNVDASGSKVVTSQSFTIEGLDELRKYRIQLIANGANGIYGPLLTTYYTTHGVGYAAGLTAQNIDPATMQIGKSFLTMTNSLSNAKKNVFQTYYRNFDAIEHGSYDIETQAGSGAQNNYSTKYYSFGTKIFFDPTIENPNQGAGIGFFLDGNASRGYFLVIESTVYSASQGRNAVRLLKVGDSVDPKVLYDSQATPSSTIQGIYGGTEYNIDIKVKVSGFSTYIKAYINGVRITATDSTKYVNSKLNVILPPTDKVGLLCTVGTAMFDYVYGSNLDDLGTSYNSLDNNVNFYQGQFSNDVLSTSFGEILYYANNSEDDYETKKTMVDEFGTVAREILKTDIKFDSRPSLPVWFSTGNNDSVSLLGASQTNFKGSAFVLNNTSTTVPLADGSYNSFFMLGNTLADSGTLEYTTDDLADYVNKEPVIFESKWLQNESDVKALAKWIKEEVINRGKSITMTVFGNPLLSLGDIVTINYPAQGFNGEERLIVTSVRHSFGDGLSTTVVCRSINKTANEATDPTIQVESEAGSANVDLATSLANAKLPSELDTTAGYGYTYWDAIPTPEAGSLSGSIFNFNKSNDLSPTDRIVVKANVNNRFVEIGSFTNYSNSINLNTMLSSIIQNDGNTPGNKRISLAMFHTRGTSRGDYRLQDISWQYTAPTA